MAASIGEDTLSNVQCAIKELRESLTDVLTGCPQFYGDDWFLVLWLRNNRFNIQKAEVAVRETIKWRKENNFQGLADEPYDPELQKVFPLHLDGVSRDGLPLLTLVVGGEVDHRGIIAKFGRDRYSIHLYRFLARAEKLAIANCHSRPSHQLTAVTSWTGCTLIADVGNYSFNQARCLTVIQCWIEIAKNFHKYFFGTVSSIYILNANKIFGPVFKVVKPFIEGPFLEMKLFNSNEDKWRDEILPKIDLRQIRPVFGGSKSEL